mgnify:CR=1 FL=1
MNAMPTTRSSGATTFSRDTRPSYFVAMKGSLGMTGSKVEGWFDSSPLDQQFALQQLRGMIRTVAKGAIELIKWGRPCYATKSGLFCYLHRSKAHITVGFQRGGELDEPDNLLEGTGKVMRHIKLTGSDEVNRKRDSIVALLKQAAKL